MKLFELVENIDDDNPFAEPILTKEEEHQFLLHRHKMLEYKVRKMFHIISAGLGREIFHTKRLVKVVKHYHVFPYFNGLYCISKHSKSNVEKWEKILKQYCLTIDAFEKNGKELEAFKIDDIPTTESVEDPFKEPEDIR